jgi:regulator of protease activity HflC (stomatin/prohibitin superfamily)
MGKFKKLTAGALLTCALSLGGCDFISPGHVGVKVNLFGSNRGVQGTTIVTGRVWYNPYTTSIYTFPTSMQYKVWTANKEEGSANDESITFVTKDRIRCNVDVSTAYMFDADKVPALFVRFRQTPDVLADTYIRSRVRDAFVREGSQLNAMEILGAGISDLDSKVKDTVDTEMSAIGIHFDYVSVIGKPRIPDQIETQIEAAIASTQQAVQAQNQVAVVTAQANQAVAKATGLANSVKAKADGDAYAALAVAQAQAKANQLLANSITPELVEYIRVQQWKGEVPSYMTAGAPIPFVNVK